MPKDISITIIILRAESTYQTGSTTITPIDSFLAAFDTSFVHIFSFELKYMRGANSCDFNFTLNGKTDNKKGGNPPFLCITTADSVLLRYIKDKFNLTYYSNKNYLVLTNTYSEEDFFSPTK